MSSSEVIRNATVSVSSEVSAASARILIQMRVALHVTFALLLGLGIYRTLADPALLASARVAATIFACLLALVYLAGTVLEKRFLQGPLGLQPPKLRFVELKVINSPRAHRTWFAIVYALWGMLVILTENFMWLAFPLFFLCLHVLGPRWGLFGVGVTVAWASIHVLLGDTTFAVPAALIGTLIGAVLAIVVSRVYRALFDEARAQRAALEELRATRSDLAFAERAAVRLAEREQIAAEVHDTIAQDLASIVLLAKSTDNRNEVVATIEASARSALENTRGLVRELGAPTTETSTRIQEVIDQVRAHAKIVDPELVIDLVVEGEPVTLPTVWQDVLQNATRASLSNVLLHAKASRAVVTLSYFSPGIRLDIVDNGIGMRGEESKRATGRGLDLLRRRVLALGGNASVVSHGGDNRDSGTSISIELGIANDSN